MEPPRMKTKRDPHANAFFQVPEGTEVTVHWNGLDDEKDSNGCASKFRPGDRVIVLPLKMEATVIEQLKCYDYPDWFWGNVKLRYDDGVEGTSNSWQLEKL